MLRLGVFALIMGVSIAACSGSEGPTGPKGDTGAKGSPGTGAAGTASISAVIPNHAFVERTINVTVSGYATSWTDATTLDFGTGITVKSVHAASPTSLVAEIEIGKAATVGTRDVVVTAGSSKETYAAAFTIDQPATVTFQGTGAQGSLGFVNIQVNDLSTPLDTTAESSLFGTTYTNLALTVPTGVTVQEIVSATLYSMQALVSIDLDAPAGTFDLDLVSGPPSTSTDIDFPNPKALTIAKRSATALTSGTAADGTNKAFQSELFSFAPSSASSTVVSFNSTAPSDPIIALLPKSGHFADLINYGASYTTLTTSTDAFYLVFWDDTGAPGAYTLTAEGTPPAAQVDASAADGVMSGAVVASAFPFVLNNGNLSTATSMDWVMITTGAGDDGKTLTAATLGDPNTDVALDIFDSTGAVDAPLDSEETGGNVTAETTVSASTVYYVVFNAGQIWSSSDTTYTGLITLQ
jgi:hypothetical protein